jgi:hypothetical protein
MKYRSEMTDKYKELSELCATKLDGRLRCHTIVLHKA